LKQSKLPKPADFKESAKNRDSTARLIHKVVQLGQAVRRHRAEGNLRSLAPPTIYGYLAFLRMATALPHLNLQQLYKSGLGTIFLTNRQLSVYKRNPFFKAKNIEVLGSSAMNRSFIERVADFKRRKNKNKKGTAVFYSPHPVKGYKESREYCIAKGIDPIEIFDKTPNEVFNIFERSESFVYLPVGMEWAGRMPVEARFLGCNVVLNDKVGVAGEPWWNLSDDLAFEFLKDTPARFWRIVEKFVNENPG